VTAILAGNDSFNLSSYADVAYGYAGNDVMYGNDGNDYLDGGSDNDALMGGTGNDTLSGGSGNDRLFGGLGNDRLTGGTGSDLFVFNTAPNATSNRDTITDFNVRDDTIQLENSVFTALGSRTGTLNATMFKTGTNNNAGDASDRIIYNQSSGALFYDADGTGITAAVQIALIGNKASLTVADFVVI
jgi:Ca2+-binding RTX toxin-like protein